MCQIKAVFWHFKIGDIRQMGNIYSGEGCGNHCVGIAVCSAILHYRTGNGQDLGCDWAGNPIKCQFYLIRWITLPSPPEYGKIPKYNKPNSLYSKTLKSPKGFTPWSLSY